MTFMTLLVGSAATASCIMYMQVGGISVIDSVITPAYAKKEVVYAQHKEVYNKIEAIIKISPTFAVAQRRVDAAIWPGKVLTVELSKVSPEDPSVTISKETAYSKGPWTNMHTVIRNGAGCGTIITDEGELDILVIDNTAQSLGRDKVHYTICIKSDQQQKRGV